MTANRIALIICSILLILSAQPLWGQGRDGHGPPPQAFEDCVERRAGDTVQHTTPEGKVSAICQDSPDGLIARPVRQSRGPSKSRPARASLPMDQQPHSGGQQYSLEQAISENAQLHTIAFSGLSFITGTSGQATFIPPGKVCDFFGFQYMRDIDSAGKGHNPVFLNRVAGNVLETLNNPQRAMLANAAHQEAAQMRLLAEKRLPLIQAFYRELHGDIPSGSKGLSREAVKRHVGDIFAFDAQISYERARLFGQLATSFTPEQKARLARMKFGDFNSWPDVDVERYKLPRGTDKLVNVVYMTYASEFFSWYAGSVEADTYFCPERHGTYFGGFYLKDMPAMGKRDYDISTSVTGDSGREFLNILTQTQRKNITSLLDLQQRDLHEIIDVRRNIATELRKFLKGESADRGKVIALGRRYGELDGEMSYYYATAFAQVAKTLSAGQKGRLVSLRVWNPSDYEGPFLYSSTMVTTMTNNTDFLFDAR